MLTAHEVVAIRRRLPGALIEPAMGEGVMISGDVWIVYASQTAPDDAWEVYPAMRADLLDEPHSRAIRSVEEALGC